MSALVESDERPVCLPGRTNELRFSQIEAAFSLPRIHKGSDSSRHASTSSMSYPNHNNDSNDTNLEKSQMCNKSRRANKKTESHHALPQSSNLLKFPGIDLHRSSSFVCLRSEFCKEKQISSRNNITDSQKKFQSPSCLLRYEAEQDESLPFHIESEPRGDNSLPGSNSVSFLPDVDNKSSVKFPSIFSHQNEYSLKVPCSLHSSSNVGSMKQEMNSFSFRLKQPFNSLPGREATLMRMKSKFTPDPENINTQKSSSQCSPLLLPISTTIDYSNRHRRQKKRKTKRSES